MSEVGQADRREALRGSPQPLYAQHDCVLLDLDGTVYVGPAAVPGAGEVVATLAGQGVRCAYLTNNASRTAAATAALLRGMGIDAEAQDVVTSAQAAAALLAAELPGGSPVLVVGGEGLIEALRDVGLVPVRSTEDHPRAVVQGFAPTVGWAELAEAAYAVHDGVPWTATNLDLSIPTARGIAPGNGSLVNTVAAATGVRPRVAGKPERPLLDAAIERTGSRSPIVVGDRLDTDIACAARAGVPSLAVLSGVTDARRLLVAAAGERPDYIAGDVGGLLLAHPAVARSQRGVWVCRGSSAWVEDAVLRVSPHGDGAGRDGAGTDGADGWDPLRAACAAAWDHDGDPLHLDDALTVLASALPGGVRASNGASAGRARSPRP